MSIIMRIPHHDKQQQPYIGSFLHGVGGVGWIYEVYLRALCGFRNFMYAVCIQKFTVARLNLDAHWNNWIESIRKGMPRIWSEIESHLMYNACIGYKKKILIKVFNRVSTSFPLVVYVGKCGVWLWIDMVSHSIIMHTARWNVWKNVSMLIKQTTKSATDGNKTVHVTRATLFPWRRSTRDGARTTFEIRSWK